MSSANVQAVQGAIDAGSGLSGGGVEDEADQTQQEQSRTECVRGAGGGDSWRRCWAGMKASSYSE